MGIASIETFVRDPMVAVVRVRTDDGAEGWGQTSPYHANITATVLHELVAPRFIGQDPWDWEALVDRFVARQPQDTGTFLFSRAVRHRYRQCGTSSPRWPASRSTNSSVVRCERPSPCTDRACAVTSPQATKPSVSDR